MSLAYCAVAPDHPVHGAYHNHEYGFPVCDERVLFERLSLEIMQAGLSWEIVLKKRQALCHAFDGFVVDRVATYTDDDVARLIADAAIIRNRLKIQAIIKNSRKIQAMRDAHGGFSKWLEIHHPRSKQDWIRLFKKEFFFTGGEIVGEFLMSIGVLEGAHDPGCPVYNIILPLNPPWMIVQKS